MVSEQKAIRKRNAALEQPDGAMWGIFRLRGPTIGQAIHRGCLDAVPDPNPTPYHPPPPPRANMFKRSRPQYRPIWRSWRALQAPENVGAPFEGVGKTGHPMCLGGALSAVQLFGRLAVLETNTL